MMRSARRLLPTGCQARGPRNNPPSRGGRPHLATTYAGVAQPVYPPGGHTVPYPANIQRVQQLINEHGASQSQSSVYNNSSGGWESISLASYTMSSVSGYLESAVVHPV